MESWTKFCSSQKISGASPHLTFHLHVGKKIMTEYSLFWGGELTVYSDAHT